MSEPNVIGTRKELGDSFVPARDQIQAACDMRTEMFFDECETWWVVAAGRSEEDAVKLIVEQEELDEEPRAGRVRGLLGSRHGEPWFKKDEAGLVEMWEVSF